MNIFKKIKEYFTDTVLIYKQKKLDKYNLELFKKTIKDEYTDPESEFNSYKLYPASDYTYIAKRLDIPEEYQLQGVDWQKRDKLNEYTYFITIYLKDKLGFKNYISEPIFYHVEDANPTEDSGVSLTYLAVWTYKPMLQQKNIRRIYVLSFIIMVILTLIAAGIKLLFSFVL